MEKLDISMKLFGEKAEDLNVLVDEVKVYYDWGDYEQDNYDKAKEWHPELIQKYDDYLAAFELANTDITEMQQDLMIESAKKYKKDGLNIRYNLILSMLNSEEALTDMQIIEQANIKDHNTAELVNSLKEVTTACDEVIKLAKDQAQIEKEFGPYNTSLDLWIGNSSGLIKGTKDFISKVEACKSNGTNDKQWREINNNLVSISQDYKQMVDHYNFMIR